MNINTNISAITTREFLRRNQEGLETSMERLSSGKRINNAGDDAAGLAISERMTSQIRGLDVANRNANDGVSLIQTAESAMGSLSSVLQRMRELTVQSSNGTYSPTDRQNLNTEFQQLLQEVDNIAYGTAFNGVKLTSVGPKPPAYDSTAVAGPAVTADDATNKITGAAATQEYRVFDKDGTEITDQFNGGTGNKWTADTTGLTLDDNADYVVHVRTIANTNTDVAATTDVDESKASNVSVLEFTKDNSGSIKRSVDLQVSDRSGELVTVNLQKTSARDLGLTSATGKAIDVSTAAGAQTAMDALDAALSTLSTSRAGLGAMQNRLGFTVDNVNTSRTNIEAAKSRVSDADMSKEMSEMTKQKVLVQSSIAMLQQANQNPQMILQLIQG